MRTIQRRRTLSQDITVFFGSIAILLFVAVGGLWVAGNVYLNRHRDMQAEANRIIQKETQEFEQQVRQFKADQDERTSTVALTAVARKMYPGLFLDVAMEDVVRLPRPTAADLYRGGAGAPPALPRPSGRTPLARADAAR
ncbi:MAG: hypothetical protein LBR07_05285 [Puniceicoccales bacterium]|jgi:hypothetical protein|nr:hypothetical protein [Puniceicoccales bacterium]